MFFSERDDGSAVACVLCDSLLCSVVLGLSALESGVFMFNYNRLYYERSLLFMYEQGISDSYTLISYRAILSLWYTCGIE